MGPKHDKRSATYNQLEAGTERARPIQHQHAHEIQPYGKIAKLPIALDEKVCAASAENLNQTPRGYDDSPRHVQETSLAGRGAHVLPTPSAL